MTVFHKVKAQAIRIDFLKVTAVISLLIAALSLYVAGQSLKVSQNVREDTRLIYGVDLRPKISFRAELQDRTVNNKKLPAAFEISNFGPVPAIQTTVQFIGHEYNEISDTIDFSFSGLRGQDHIVGTVEPLNSEVGLIDQEFLHALQSGWGLNNATSTNLLVEVRVSYRKDPDKRLFLDRAFYFMNEDGIWVNENSLNSEKYARMKDVVEKTFRPEIGPRFEDTLHAVNFSEN